MILGTGTRTAVAAVLVIAFALSLITLGWNARGVVADRDMAEFKQGLQDQKDQQAEQVRQAEQKQADATAQSTQRLDEQQAAQQQETVYVEKQVVQYRDRWRDRPCDRPDWVRLYNESLFGSGAVPATR